MAKILGIKELPVKIESIHYDWDLTCQRQYSGSLPEVISKGLQSKSIDSSD